MRNVKVYLYHSYTTAKLELVLEARFTDRIKEGYTFIIFLVLQMIAELCVEF